ncbi:DUF2784 domain-containing protein [Massilia cavernae]|uniref:DUF2784 domain-containing protein n=1 Tax=Massilia cavernae TaxID=2320864 RepID=A0A418XQM2_9BURK|nr:DUF2784 domain-containing protein [Massilia cavernae]RJG14780.1 DUF2784 domain-containing protein [Massilia cavernae]
MNFDPSTYRTLADAVLVLHLGVVVFIVGGLVVILSGARLNWMWVRDMRFRVLHLAAIGYVVVTTWFGIECGLTTLEQSLRVRSGQLSFEGDFIAHWISRIMFYEAPPWVFAAVYTAFGLLVAWSWLSVPPHRLRRRIPHAN